MYYPCGNSGGMRSFRGMRLFRWRLKDDFIHCCSRELEPARVKRYYAICCGRIVYPARATARAEMKLFCNTQLDSFTFANACTASSWTLVLLARSQACATARRRNEPKLSVGFIGNSTAAALKPLRVTDCKQDCPRWPTTRGPRQPQDEPKTATGRARGSYRTGPRQPKSPSQAPEGAPKEHIRGPKGASDDMCHVV